MSNGTIASPATASYELERKSFLNSTMTNPDPHNVTLTNMHDTLDIIHQMMELALKDGLKI